MKLFDVDPAMPDLKSNEWYTPAHIIKAARAVLGQIDLDPASCLQANQTVKATQYYTVDQDGLKQPWYGRVWCNPPFSRPNVARGMEPGDHTQTRSILQAWIDKLLAEYKSGNVPAAILLVKADLKQLWFQPLLDYTLCFARDRVYFNRPGLEPEKMMFGTAFVYFGTDTMRFVEVFRRFGRVLQAIDDPIVEPVTLWSYTEEVAS